MSEVQCMVVLVVYTVEVHSLNENEYRRGPSRSNYFTRIGALRSWRSRALGPVVVFSRRVVLGRIWGAVYGRLQTFVVVPGLALRWYTRWSCLLKCAILLLLGHQIGEMLSWLVAPGRLVVCTAVQIRRRKESAAPSRWLPKAKICQMCVVW